MISKNVLGLAALAGLLMIGTLLEAQTVSPPAAGAQAKSAPTGQTAPAPAVRSGAPSGAAPGATGAAASGAKSGATSSATMSAEAAIRAVLERQAFDWNRGDTDGFLVGYAEDAVFVSDTVTRGLDKLRVRYQSHYPTRASMGTLTFADVEVHMIDTNNAYVIGHFHLARNADGGGDSNGVYTLLFKRGPKGWKIVVDHTS